MITTGTVARQVCQNLLQRAYYVRNTYEFRLPWRWCFLEPMDVVTLTDADTGLSLDPVRIIEVTEDEYGTLQVIAEELPDGIGHGAGYATQPMSRPTSTRTSTPRPDHRAVPVPRAGLPRFGRRPEIWCAVASQSEWWGGCDVYISQDGTSYTYLKTHIGEAATATSRTPSPPAPTSTIRTSRTWSSTATGPGRRFGGRPRRVHHAVDAGHGTVRVSHGHAGGGAQLNVSSLRRGGYGTTNVPHAINAPFVRLDDNIIKIPIDASQLGSTIYLKFLSFNCFGQGARTLASETAYSYVVGSNVEFPDVPVVPSSVTVVGVADGVNLAWVNSNPAAVACTSIEFATASGGPWTVLGQEGPTVTTYHHAFTGGGTYFYRLRSRGHQVSAGWSAYTSVFSASAVDVAAIKADVDDISNDNKISPPEKPSLIIDYNTLTAEQSGLDSQATAFGVTTEKTTYDNNLTALTSLATLTAGAVEQQDRLHDRGRGDDADEVPRRVHRAHGAGEQVRRGGEVHRRRQDPVLPPDHHADDHRRGLAVVQPGYGRDLQLGWNLVDRHDRFVARLGIGQPGAELRFHAEHQRHAEQRPRSVGDSVSDGWVVNGVGAQSQCYVRWLSSNCTVRMFYGNDTLAAGVLSQSTVDMRKAVPIIAGKSYMLTFVTVGNAFNVTNLTNIDVRQRANALLRPDRRADRRRHRLHGNRLRQQPYLGHLLRRIHCSTGAVTVKFELSLYVKNNGATTWTPNNTVTLDVRFSSVTVIRQANLDNEVVDGTNYGRLHWNDLYSTGGFNRLGLLRASGQRIGDSRNLPA